MALTKPKLSHNIDTDSSVFTDPILVLHQSATSANVDSGFLFNRANGLVSNVAIYWSESANTFVTAFTTNAGSSNSNIAVSTYANLRTGAITSNSITNSGTLVIGNTGDVSANIGAFHTYANVTFATQAGTSSAIDANIGAFYNYANTKIGTNSNGNLVVAALTQSTSTTTGALVVGGGAAVGGNLYVGGNLIVANVVYQNSEVITTTELVQGNIVAASSAVSTSTTTGALVVVGGAGIGGALYIANTGDVSANIGAYRTYANANVVAIQANLGAYQTYANANVAAIQANLGAYQTYANANVVAIQANLGAYQTYANANLSTQTTNFNTLNANVSAYQTYANANVVAIQANLGAYQTYANANIAAIQANLGAYQTYANANVVAIQANLGAYQIYSNANAATQAIAIDTVNANIGAYQTYANANVVAIQANLGAYQTYANANIAAIQANLGAYQTYANANVVAIQANLGAYQIYSNANAATQAIAIDTVNANIGAYQTYANANLSTQTTNFNILSANVGAYETYANANIATIQANLGAFYNYANTKIGTNTNSNLVVTSTAESINTTTGALVVGGGAAVGGNLYVGGNLNIAGNTFIVDSTINNQVTGNLIVGSPITFPALNANIQYGGNQNSYLQLLMQNANSGSAASTDFVAAADNAGSDTDTYIDMGINSSTYSQAGYTANYPNDGYLYVQGNTTTGGGNLIIATMTDRDIVFTTGGQNLNNEVMRITSGNVVQVTNNQSSISTTTGALVVAGGAGIAGNVSADKFYTTNGLYWSGNGVSINVSTLDDLSDVVITAPSSNQVLKYDGTKWVNGSVPGGGGGGGGSGITYTAAIIPPVTANVADQWYDTTNDVLYEYLDDGTNQYWVDVQSQGQVGNIITVIDATLAGNIVVGVNDRYSIGAPSGYLKTIYANTIVGNTTTLSGITTISNTTNSVPYVMGSGAFYVAGGISIGKDIWVGGNLYVANIISQTTSILEVNDPLIYLKSDSATYNYDIGIFSQFTGGPVGLTSYTGMARSYQTNTWNFFSNIEQPVAGTINFSNTGIVWDTVKAGNLIVANGNITPTSNLTQNIGSVSSWWKTFYGVSTQAQYADLAERYCADANYEPGTVVVFGGEYEITISTKDHDSAVAGVISTDPAYLMNAAADGLPVALQGRAPCQVQGPIRKGELVVSSNVPGVAQRFVKERFEHGCIIGKSLENINDDTIKTIEVVVGRY